MCSVAVLSVRGSTNVARQVPDVGRHSRGRGRAYRCCCSLYLPQPVHLAGSDAPVSVNHLGHPHLPSRRASDGWKQVIFVSDETAVFAVLGERRSWSACGTPRQQQARPCLPHTRLTGLRYDSRSKHAHIAGRGGAVGVISNLQPRDSRSGPIAAGSKLR